MPELQGYHVVNVTPVTAEPLLGQQPRRSEDGRHTTAHRDEIVRKTKAACYVLRTTVKGVDSDS